ncbi:MAG: DUF4397 domain-containing protein [Polyangiaceae bacterium]
MKRLSFFLASVMALATAAGGCIDTISDDDDFEYEHDDDGNELGAAVRIVHVAPDSSNVDVYLNGSGPAFSGIGYAQSSGSLEVVAGGYEIAVVAQGTKTPLVTLPATPLSPASTTTTVLYGSTTQPAALTIEEDFSPVLEGQVRLRVVHVATGALPVDVYEETTNPTPTQLYDELAYGIAGPTFELPAPNASAPLVLSMDVDDDLEADATFNITDLPGGAIANAFVVTTASGDLSLLVQQDNGVVTTVSSGDPTEPLPAEVRAVHLSGDAPPLTFGVEGPHAALADSLQFTEGTDFVGFQPGSYLVSVATVEDPGTSLHDFELNDLLPGSRHTVVAFGDFDGLEGLMLEDVAADAPDVAALIEAGQYRVRAIHTAPSLGQIDVWDLTDSQEPLMLDANVSFGQAGAYIDLASGVGGFLLGFDANGDQISDATFELPDMAAGEIANLYAASEGPTISLVAQMTSGEILRIENIAP